MLFLNITAINREGRCDLNKIFLDRRGRAILNNATINVKILNISGLKTSISKSHLLQINIQPKEAGTGSAVVARISITQPDFIEFNGKATTQTCKRTLILYAQFL